MITIKIYYLAKIHEKDLINIKKLLEISGIITIAGSGMSTIVGNSNGPGPTKQEKTIKNNNKNNFIQQNIFKKNEK